GLVVGAWLLVGWFIVPRLLRVVTARGSDEVIIVAALALCLALVTLSAYFHYSVALGAFIMGSILAETREVERIEGLVAPFKDLFGA
ncbi:cation:proton antiporter domain-containing protein, partial [Klebsiella pneumoniae]